jgi:hypothetical protein
MTDSGRIPAGFDLILYGVVDNDGFLIGGVADGAVAGSVSSMKRLYGAKTAPVQVKEPEVVVATGDNDSLVSFQFEAAELPDGVLTIAPRDLDFDALVQGTATYALHQQKFGVLQPGNADPPNICLLLMRRAKTWGANSKGSEVWDCLLIPSCSITPLGSEFTERAVNAEAYKINLSKASHFVWGETLAASNIGSNAAPIIRFDSDNPVHAVALKGDGATLAFSVPYTPVSDARSMIHVNRVEKVVTTHWNLASKTFTFTGGNAPINGARGVIWYETSEQEIV